MCHFKCDRTSFILLENAKSVCVLIFIISVFFLTAHFLIIILHPFFLLFFLSFSSSPSHPLPPPTHPSPLFFFFQLSNTSRLNCSSLRLVKLAVKWQAGSVDAISTGTDSSGSCKTLVLSLVLRSPLLSAFSFFTRF